MVLSRYISSSLTNANLIKYTAAAYGSRDFRQDLQMYQSFMQQANAEEQSLMNITRKSNATGSTTIYSMSVVVEKYDYCYGRLFSHSKGKFDYEIIHERAFKLTHKLLT